MLPEHVKNLKYELSQNLRETKQLITNKFEKIDVENVKYELYKGVERGKELAGKGIEKVDYEFNRRIHIFLLLIFIAFSTVFVL